MSVIQEVRNRIVSTTPDYMELRRTNLQLVFVYGTLMSGKSNHRKFLNDAHSLGDAITSSGGLSMHDLGAFPAVFKDDSDCVKNLRIFGEVFVVDPLLMLDLDHLEQNGKLYKREKRNVTMFRQRVRIEKDNVVTNPPMVRPAWVYIGQEMIFPNIPNEVVEETYKIFTVQKWNK